MKAAVLEALREPLHIRDVPDPAPPPGGAVVRVEACGICRSDWHIWRGDIAVQLPRIMGHEFAGLIEALDPSVKGFTVGERVVVPFSLGDGTCDLCRGGHSNICDNRISPGITADGAYARYAPVPYAGHGGLIRLPDGISFRDAASLGCRFMTAFHGLVDQAEVRPGEWVAIYGCGGVGLSALNIAAAIGANPIAVDIIPSKLDLAKELGAVATVDASAADPVEAVLEITKGGAHVAVDAMGSTRTAGDAIRSLRKRGRMLQIGLPVAEEPDLHVPMLPLVRSELRLIGSLGMPPHRYPELLRLVEQGRLQPGRLVAGEVSLHDATGVLQEMDRFGGVGIQVITLFE